MPNAPAVTSRVRVVRCNTTDLTPADHDRIASFFTRYSLIERKTLDETLNAATYIWLCLDNVGRIVGTTAVRRLKLPPGTGGHSGSVTAVYTSVVAVNPSYRRLGLPARMGMKTYLHERMRSLFTPLYWLAEAASPAGYLLVARNLSVFWPRPRQRVPGYAQAVIDAALSAAGVTRITRQGDLHLVQEDYAVIEREQAPERWNRDDVDVDFFLRTNPQYWTGAALVCITPLSFVSVTSAVAGAMFRVLTRKKRTRARI